MDKRYRLCRLLAALVLLPASSLSSALSITPELLNNGDAEAGSMASWSHSALFTTVTAQGQSTGTVHPHGGSYFFSTAQGASGYQYAYQMVDVRAYAGYIDGGATQFDASFWYQNEHVNWGNGQDAGKLSLFFHDSLGGLLGSATTGEITHGNSNYWSHETLSGLVPAGTTDIKYLFEGYLHTGSYVNIFFDDASLTLAYEPQAVPLPATAWLLFSALLGMLGLGRRP